MHALFAQASIIAIYEKTEPVFYSSLIFDNIRAYMAIFAAHRHRENFSGSPQHQLTSPPVNPSPFRWRWGDLPNHKIAVAGSFLPI